MPNSSWLDPQSIYYNHGNKPGRVYGKGLSQLFQSKLGGTGMAKYLQGDHSFMDPTNYLYEQKIAFFKEQLSKADLPKLTSECLSYSHTWDEAF